MVALVVAGCAPPPAAPASEAAPAARAAPPDSPIDAEDLERLRSLGYLGTAGLPKLGAGRGVTILEPASVAPGYTLVVFAGSCTCQILSPAGEVVRSWRDASCHRWDHAELLPDGDVVVVGSKFDEDEVEDPIETGRYLMRLRPSGEVVWRKEINAHHDVSLTPEGKLLTLVMTRRRVPVIDPDHDVADDYLTLLSTDGEILESFSLLDLLISSKLRYPIQKAGTRDLGKSELIDLLHCNTIRSASIPALEGRNPIYGRSAVIVTSRHQDEVMIIEWTTRQLLWHWGRGVLSGPHEGTVLPNGNILVFDNGLTRSWSRVLELNPLAPEELRQFASGGQKFFDRVMGSCQRLSNGNTLIVHSEGGSALELTPQGQPVWTYEGTEQTPDGHRVKIIRMRRIPAFEVEELVKRASGAVPRN